MIVRMESKSDSSSSMNTTNNNSHKGGQSDIEDVITNPREPWATKVQRIDHSDQVEDEEEDQLVVNPKFSAAPGEVSTSPGNDCEVGHLPVGLQDLPTNTNKAG